MKYHYFRNLMKTTKPYFSALMLVAAIAASAALTGCSDSSTTATTPNKPITPKVGSTYTFRQHESDSTAGKPTTTTDTTLTFTVVSSGQTLAGMTGVVTAVSTMGDTEIYAFDANGDLNVYIAKVDASIFTLQAPNPWFRVPTYSKASTLQLAAFDTSVTISGFPVPVHTVVTSAYVGTDQDALIATNAPSGGKAQLDLTLTGTIPILGQAVATARNTYSVDGTIGFYFHKTFELNTPSISTIAATSTVRDRWLVSYSVIK